MDEKDFVLRMGIIIGLLMIVGVIMHFCEQMGW